LLRRRLNYEEIYGQFDVKGAAEQASRCSQCGIPFCQIHCPLQNNIPDWLKLTAEGRLEEAYALSSATNTFPEVCGRICPQDKLCEGNCVIEKGFGAVTIGSIEKYITETAFAEGWVKPIKSARESGFSIGIVGSGPAGLAAADMLRRAGHEVHVYDRYDRAGGLLMYGIPNFKLEKEVVTRRIDLLTKGGIKFHLNHEVKNLRDLQKKHNAILIATGVYKAREIESPNASLENIIPALPYLIAANRGEGENLEGKEVVVIGGGDTAMDCVRTAVRQNAKKVTCLYRRDRANMPGSAREVKNAEEEGVKFTWLSTPRAFIGDRAVSELIVQRMRLLPADASGRQAVAPVEEDTYRLKADLVVKALGFDAEDLPALWNEPDLSLSKYGTLKVDSAMMTSIPGVFAAGDIVRGASLVVWAIRDGRDAAQAMHQYLQQHARKAA
jgi:glutamate synthase (NADPH/NADH) small chain